MITGVMYGAITHTYEKVNEKKALRSYCFEMNGEPCMEPPMYCLV